MEIFAHVSDGVEAKLLTETEEAKLVVDLNKLLNKYSRDMAIDSLASVIGKVVQDQWGAHNTQRFTNKFIIAVKEASELEKQGE